VSHAGILRWNRGPGTTTALLGAFDYSFCRVGESGLLGGYNHATSTTEMIINRNQATNFVSGTICHPST
jgi:hypothetical protein